MYVIVNVRENAYTYKFGIFWGMQIVLSSMAISLYIISGIIITSDIELIRDRQRHATARIVYNTSLCHIRIPGEI